MKHVKKMLLLAIIITLLIGIANATDTTNQTTNTQDMIKDTHTIHTDMTKDTDNNIKQADTKKATKTTVTKTNGTIGEKLDLNAKVTSNNKAVNEGYVIFKLNGITLKDNKKLTDSDNPLKVYVQDGMANTTVIADLSMRYAQNLTAVYSGTSTFNSSRSNTAKAQIQQRNASIVVSSNVKTIRQGQKLTLKAQIYDTTNNQKSTKIIAFEDEYVYFKVNGLTLKNSAGEVLKTKVTNGVATTDYTIPLGLSGVTDAQTMTPKNHTILAGFYNKNYQENIRNTSTFQVERSPITINIDNVTLDNKKHHLSLNASIKDYLGNYVSGPNKCIIKINGVSLKNGTNPMFYYSTDGRLNIKNTPLPLQDKYSTLEIVTQDRLAYKSARNTTSKFNIIKQNTIIRLDAIDKIDFNKNVTLTGKIIGQSNEMLNNKTLTVNFNGATRKINTDNKGNFKYSNKTNKVAANSITVTFDGDTNYISSSNKTTFQVIHKPTIIDFTVRDTNYSDYTEISGYLADKDNNKLKQTRIILTINNETCNIRTDEYGEFYYVHNAEKSGKNNVTAKFNGTEYYNPVSKSKTFNVFKIESTVYIDSFPDVVPLGEVIPVSGGVLNDRNNMIDNANLTIKINNERFNIKTDNYGYYSFNYKTTKVGTNTVEATVTGNENYLTSTNSNSFTVM
ncbi:MAG: Ig-like domain repeat protein, partial [Methanosphaera sp.]|nr:Ig-like domain repeat protein [Methanosphaera sp.]